MWIFLFILTILSAKDESNDRSSYEVALSESRNLNVQDIIQNVKDYWVAAWGILGVGAYLIGSVLTTIHVAVASTFFAVSAYCFFMLFLPQIFAIFMCLSGVPMSRSRDLESSNQLTKAQLAEMASPKNLKYLEENSLIFMNHYWNCITEDPIEHEFFVEPNNTRIFECKGEQDGEKITSMFIIPDFKDAFVMAYGHAPKNGPELQMDVLYEKCPRNGCHWDVEDVIRFERETFHTNTLSTLYTERNSVNFKDCRLWSNFIKKKMTDVRKWAEENHDESFGKFDADLKKEKFNTCINKHLELPGKCKKKSRRRL